MKERETRNRERNKILTMEDVVKNSKCWKWINTRIKKKWRLQIEVMNVISVSMMIWQMKITEKIYVTK
jgi:hypothetical protein